MSAGMPTAVSTGLTLMQAGGGIMQAFSQQKAGSEYANSMMRQAEHNAQIFEQQAAMIQARKKIEDYQYKRAAKKLRGTVISRTAGKGLQLTGSPLAVMVDNESQLLFDKAISEYNLDVEANYARSAAAQARYIGAENARYARAQGSANSLTSILSSVSKFDKLYPLMGMFSGGGSSSNKTTKPKSGSSKGGRYA